MTRKLKALGLALVAVCAMSAIAASSASATDLTVNTVPAEFKGSQPAGAPHKFVADGFTTECKVAEFSGTINAIAVTTITVTPVYKECTSSGFATEVQMNGCKYEFHLEGTSGLTPEAKVTLECEAGKEPTIIVGGGICVIHVEPFGTTAADPSKSHVTLHNDHPGILATSTVTGIKANMTDASFLCPLNGNTTVSNATYNGDVTLKPTNAAHTAILSQ